MLHGRPSTGGSLRASTLASHGYVMLEESPTASGNVLHSFTEPIPVPERYARLLNTANQYRTDRETHRVAESRSNSWQCRDRVTGSREHATAPQVLQPCAQLPMLKCGRVRQTECSVGDPQDCPSLLSWPEQPSIAPCGGESRSMRGTGLILNHIPQASLAVANPRHSSS